MILSRCPLRLTLGGGGTDLPAYCRTHPSGGYVVSVAIDRYVYVTVNPRFESSHLLKYSKTEEVTCWADIEHKILREAFRVAGPKKDEFVEVTAMADLPSRSGLGSSSAFTVALLNALYTYRGDMLPPARLAEYAAQVEKAVAGHDIGKQDHYSCAMGGITEMVFLQDGHVDARRSLARYADLEQLLSEWILLFDTGTRRDAGGVLTSQAEQVRFDAKQPFPFTGERMNVIRTLGRAAFRALEAKDLPGLAEQWRQHWLMKRTMAEGMVPPALDAHLTEGVNAGALAGKISGAGGGGFLAFLCPPDKRDAVSEVMRHRGCKRAMWHVAQDGARIVANHAR